VRTAVGRRATRESINRYRAPLFDSEHRPVGRYDKLTTACTNDSLRARTDAMERVTTRFHRSCLPAAE